MEQELNHIQLRSHEVQEILGHIPSKLIRYGITVILAVILVIFSGSFFFKYPDIIQANFEIVTQNPPAEIIAKANGNLTHIFVADSQLVHTNQLLGIIQNPANATHVLKLHNWLPNIEKKLFDPILVNSLPDTLQLGDLQSYYSALYKASQEYNQYFELKYFECKISALQQKKEQLKNYLILLKEQADLKESELKITEKQFGRDSSLFIKEVISASDLENSKKTLIQQQYALRSQKSSVINTQLQINEIDQQITEYQLEEKKQDNQYKQALTELFNNLDSRLAWWFDLYVLVSPINGNVAFNKIWSDNQFITSGVQVFSIIPNEKQTIIGRVTINSAGVGKIKPNQNVNLKFNNYPYQEFGMIRAKIKSISMVPVDDEYFIELQLPDTLVTNYGKTLPFSQKMSGVAEVITEDLPLIARLFNPLKDILKSHVDIEPQISQIAKEQVPVKNKNNFQQLNAKNTAQQITIKEDSILKSNIVQHSKKPNQQQNTFTYHIIVASSLKKAQLQLAINDYNALGYKCTILKSESNRFRLSVYSSTEKANAIMQLAEIRKVVGNNSIWLLKVAN